MTLTLKIATTTTTNFHMTLAHDAASPYQLLVTKCSVIQKISPRQTFTDILNRRCDLDLEHSNPIFPQDTLVYDAKLYIKPSLIANRPLDCKLTSSLEDTTQIVIF